MTDTERSPVDFRIPDHWHDLRWHDHRFMGTAVLPAVAAMEWMARAVAGRSLEHPPTTVTAASFEKFLFLTGPMTPEAVFVETEILHPGSVVARLTSRTRTKSGMARMKIHAVATFSDDPPACSRTASPPPPSRQDRFTIPADRVYQDLVPFGPAFHTIQDHVKLTPDMAEAPLSGCGDHGSASILGSVFPLDGAFHAACVWGQRYAGVVAFPVAFERRIIPAPTRPGEEYQAVALPLERNPERLVFDLHVYDRQGTLREAVAGLVMRDVSGGRWRPPKWVRA